MKKLMVMFAVLALVTTAMAQPGPGGAGGRRGMGFGMGGGFGLLMMPEVQKEINLTEQQRQQIQQLMAEQREQMMPLRQQMRQQMDKELLAVLTEPQQEQWKKMQGKPFQFPRGPFGGGRGFGGPPAGAGGGSRQL